MQGLHEAGYEVIIVGHSLGAGAAALLALIFREKWGPPCAVRLLTRCNLLFPHLSSDGTPSTLAGINMSSAVDCIRCSSLCSTCPQADFEKTAHKLSLKIPSQKLACIAGVSKTCTCMASAARHAWTLAWHHAALRSC